MKNIETNKHDVYIKNEDGIDDYRDASYRLKKDALNHIKLNLDITRKLGEI